ncbi:MAG: hypothetical protein K9M75_11465 [Phycisphaerae bacterium]|nr:hypothetical protein [Phycisphaerae bacterium]
MEPLGYKDIKDNEISNFWDEYNESWRTSLAPWLDMIKKGANGRSVFANKVIEKFEEAKQAIDSL